MLVANIASNRQESSEAASNGKIVYTKQVGVNFSLVVTNSDGTSAQTIATDLYQPDWSPDGTKIVAAANDGLYVINADGSGKTKITSSLSVGGDAFPVWYKSDSVLFTRYTPGSPNQVWAASPTGSGASLVINNASMADASPDGSQMVFSSYFSTSIYKHTVSTGAEVLLAFDGSNFLSWSPDGSKILYGTSAGSGVNHISAIDAAGNWLGDILPASLGYSTSNAKWSPDGTKIVFRCDNGGVNICTANANGSNISRITDAAATGASYTFSSWQPTNPPPTTPTPTPPPSGGGSTPQSTTPPTTATKPKTTTTPPSNNTEPPDTTPPARPGNFKAATDVTKPGVQLTWDASTDNKGISAYVLERSTDGATYAVVDDQILGTEYFDSVTSFGQKYLYKLTAKDTAGNASEAATSEVTTPSFVANSGAGIDGRVTSDDGIITVHVPKDALSSPALCSVANNTDSLGPSVDGYTLVAGPYEMICKLENGTLITAFDKPLIVSVKPSKKMLKTYSNLVYYSQSKEAWNKLVIIEHDKTGNVDVFELKDATVFAVSGAPKEKQIWLIVGVAIGSIALLAITFMWIKNKLAERNLDRWYTDYFRKNNGI